MQYQFFNCKIKTESKSKTLRLNQDIQRLISFVS